MFLTLPNAFDIGDLSTQASPSKARAEALEVHSWSLVMKWLSALYQPSPIPSFERNGTTLKALQSLMAENLAADKLRDLLFQAQLEELKVSQDCSSMPEENSPDSLLRLLNSSLPQPAESALKSLASSAVLLGCTTSNTDESILDNLSTQILKMPHDTFELETQLSSINGLISDLQMEIVQLQTPAPRREYDYQPENDESASDLESQPSTPGFSTSSAINYSHLHRRRSSISGIRSSCCLNARSTRIELSPCSDKPAPEPSLGQPLQTWPRSKEPSMRRKREWRRWRQRSASSTVCRRTLTCQGPKCKRHKRNWTR